MVCFIFFTFFRGICTFFFFIDFLMDFANRNIRYGFLKGATGSENVEIPSYEQPLIKVISKYSIADPNVSQFLKNVPKFERSVSVPANHFVFSLLKKSLIENHIQSAMAFHIMGCTVRASGGAATPPEAVQNNSTAGLTSFQSLLGGC